MSWEGKWTDAETSELNAMKRMAGIGEPEIFVQLPNAEWRGRSGGPTMEDRVPPKDWPNMVTGELNESPGDAQEEYLMSANLEKITKTISGTATAMDKADRKGVTNPSKANVSVYINYILEQVIEDLQTQGYEVNWTEREYD